MYIHTDGTGYLYVPVRAKMPAPSRRPLLLLFSLAAHPCIGPSEHNAALRAAAVFEGLMAALGLQIEPHALPRAIGPERHMCGMHFERTYIEINAALTSLHSILSRTPKAVDERVRDDVVGTLHRLGHGLRGFVAALHRCNIRAADRVGSLARVALGVHRKNVQSIAARHPLSAADQPSAPERAVPAALEVHVDGFDLSSELMDAGLAMRDGRYHLAGLQLVLALGRGRHEGDEDDGLHDSVPFERHEHVMLDVNGRGGHHSRWDHTRRLRQEHELHAHWRNRRERRRAQLEQAKQALEAVAPLVLADDDAVAVLADGGDMCCCCWSFATERQERSVSDAHFR